MLLKKKNQLNYRFMESEQNFCLKRIKNKLYKTYLIIFLFFAIVKLSFYLGQLKMKLENF
jgi:hypothetical protein